MKLDKDLQIGFSAFVAGIIAALMVFFAISSVSRKCGHISDQLAECQDQVETLKSKNKKKRR